MTVSDLHWGEKCCEDKWFFYSSLEEKATSKQVYRGFKIWKQYLIPLCSFDRQLLVFFIIIMST